MKTKLKDKRLRSVICDSVWGSVCDSVANPVFDTVYNSVGNPVRSSVKNSVFGSVYNSVTIILLGGSVLFGIIDKSINIK
jgi:hypothetical protein